MASQFTAIFKLTISAGVGKFYVRTEVSRNGGLYQLMPTQGPFESHEKAVIAADEFAAKASKLIDWNGSVGTFEVAK